MSGGQSACLTALREEQGRRELPEQKTPTEGGLEQQAFSLALSPSVFRPHLYPQGIGWGERPRISLFCAFNHGEQSSQKTLLCHLTFGFLMPGLGLYPASGSLGINHQMYM